MDLNIGTHMDLNIGTAFWFAARGKGYLYDCSTPSSCSLSADRSKEQLLNHEGRPLLRVGALQAAQSVGLSELIPLQRKGMEKRTCSNTACGRFSKDKCISALCGKCCKRSQIKLSNCCPVHRLTSFAHDAPSSAKQHDVEVKRAEYTSEARALLIGIGADEHLAGYGRHRTVFEKDGLEALQRELCIDQTRLWQRNLGRDDRCVADNGREAWYPYIDEEVVSLLYSLNLLDLADLRLGQGEGDKRILRDASRLIGLKTCSALVKRAIQFGTKIAKVTNVTYHGSNRRGRGDEEITAIRLDDDG